MVSWTPPSSLPHPNPKRPGPSWVPSSHPGAPALKARLSRWHLCGSVLVHLGSHGLSLPRHSSSRTGMTLSFNSREVSALPSPACTRPLAYPLVHRHPSPCYVQSPAVKSLVRGHTAGREQSQGAHLPPAQHQGPTLPARLCLPQPLAGFPGAPTGATVPEDTPTESFLPGGPTSGVCPQPRGALPSRDSQWLSPVWALWVSNKVGK